MIPRSSGAGYIVLRARGPNDLVPYWDFAVSGNEPRDISAAALVAYGLTRLPPDDEVSDLRETGFEVLDTIVREHIVLDPADDRYGMVLHSYLNKPGEYLVNQELVFTHTTLSVP